MISPESVARLVDPRRGSGATSILATWFLPKRFPADRERVRASIYIHPQANRHLARICIAHELYHLLMELDQYNKHRKHGWPTPTPVTKATEDACNQFAWELCRKHDEFNKKQENRERLIYFPPHVFDAPLKTHSTHNSYEWPEGIALDPKNPFHVKPLA